MKLKDEKKLPLNDVKFSLKFKVSAWQVNKSLNSQKNLKKLSIQNSEVNINS